MNVKEIALAVNKKERSIHYWIEKVSANNAQVRAKIAQASNDKKPADYNLEETCLIIEQGLGKNAAALFRSNAMEKKSENNINNRLDRIEMVVEKLLQLQIDKNIDNQKSILLLSDNKSISKDLIIIKEDETGMIFEYHDERYLLFREDGCGLWMIKHEKSNRYIKRDIVSKYKALEWIKKNL